MPKRTLEDTELNSGDNDIKVSSKKSRKEKREKKSKDVEEPATDSTPTEVEVESKEARKERRRLKKAKKAQEAEKEANREQLDEDNAIEPASDGNAAADAKAAKKVEKARLKALKREGKQERPESPKSTEPGAPVTVSPQQNGITYTEDSNLSALPQSEIDSFLTTNFITITDPLSTSATLRPLTKFDYLPITDPAQRAPFKDFKARLLSKPQHGHFCSLVAM
ncbi:hypothetical protein DID88_006894 [Monilinia fructigena]|uniref:Uncharacterized protein n=1 Tax=Monilinia fructigena TaxID=38457 RepID=A0A395IGW4_9HELO|nr:hypothetical protein DID88_006894 [Monilinia fructigena]